MTARGADAGTLAGLDKGASARIVGTVRAAKCIPSADGAVFAAVLECVADSVEHSPPSRAPALTDRPPSEAPEAWDRAMATHVVGANIPQTSVTLADLGDGMALAAASLAADVPAQRRRFR